MTDKLIRHQTSQLASLRSEDFASNFIIRASKGEVSPSELRVTRVEARMNSYAIKRMDERALILGLTKIITDIFDYFNTDFNESIISMLIGDIIDEYGMYSALEIYKALHEGRRTQKELYGKLSGRHITNWLVNYFAKMDEDIATFRQNEKYEMSKALDDLHIPGNEPAKKDPEDPEKREFSVKEKEEALKVLMKLSPAEQARRDHSNKWSYKVHGDYEAYMRAYDSNVKTE